MVRFSQSLNTGQRNNRRNDVPQQNNNADYFRYDERPQETYRQPTKPVYQNPDNFYRQPQRPVYEAREDPFEVEYEQPQRQVPFEIPTPQEELKFPAEDNIKFGVKYSPNSRPPVIGKNYTIRSNSIIYNDVVIGDNFRTGHNVVIRENTNIGDDVLIGTNTVIEGDVIIGNDVSIQSNVYIPTNSVIEDNVFIGPCACFTNDKYPVRINYELQGPKIRRGASIGGNTTFLSNVEIGEGSIVAAGAIVIHSVPPFYLAIGTPARIKPLPDHLKVPNRF